MQITKKPSCQNLTLAGRQIFSFFILFAILFAMAHLILIQNTEMASAGSLWDSQVGLEDEIGKKAFGQTGDPKDIRLIVAGVIRAFLGFMGIIFFIMILLAGYKWMTSGGNEEKVKEAQSQMTKAFFGLVIILMAWFIASFVAGCLSDISSNAFFKKYCP